MAMIKCPECGREISDSASRCPHCGKISKNHEINTAVVATVLGTLPFDIGGAILFIVGIVKANDAYYRSEQESATLMIIFGIIIMIIGFIVYLVCMGKIKARKQELEREEQQAKGNLTDAIEAFNEGKPVECPRCHTTVYKGDKCSLCGYDFRIMLRATKKESPITVVKKTDHEMQRNTFCYQCGAKLPERSRFCPRCGIEQLQ